MHVFKKTPYIYHLLTNRGGTKEAAISKLHFKCYYIHFEILWFSHNSKNGTKQQYELSQLKPSTLKTASWSSNNIFACWCDAPQEQLILTLLLMPTFPQHSTPLVLSVQSVEETDSAFKKHPTNLQTPHNSATSDHNWTGQYFLRLLSWNKV